MVSRGVFQLFEVSKQRTNEENNSMKYLNTFLTLLFLTASVFVLIGCQNNKEQTSKHKNENPEVVNSTSNSDRNYTNTKKIEEKNSNNSSVNGDCNFDNGTYSATVDYNNPETGYSTTYTLDVEVQDCQVIQINFPNGGYLDEDHISYANIDENGNAIVDGEEGKTYEVHIDN